MANRWSWLLVVAFSTRSASLSCCEWIRTGCSDRDRVVEGERADQLRRGIVDMGQAAGQSRPRLDFDVGAELLQHIVKQRDLLAGIAARAGREQIGDALQNALALVTAAGRERGVQLVDQRLIFVAAGIWSGGRGVGHGNYNQWYSNGAFLSFLFAHRGASMKSTCILQTKCKNSRNPGKAKRRKILRKLPTRARRSSGPILRTPGRKGPLETRISRCHRSGYCRRLSSYPPNARVRRRRNDNPICFRISPAAWR